MEQEKYFELVDRAYDEQSGPALENCLLALPEQNGRMKPRLNCCVP